LANCCHLGRFFYFLKITWVAQNVGLMSSQKKVSVKCDKWFLEIIKETSLTIPVTKYGLGNILGD
jgi:hypothetical protein